jgi:hypothetical protein
MIRVRRTAAIVGTLALLLAATAAIPVRAADPSPAIGSFSPAGSLAEARTGHTATLLSDGRLLVAGGRVTSYGLSTASAEVWDPAIGTFGPSGSLGEAREGHSATLLLDGRVLVIGGSMITEEMTTTEGDLARFLATAELWDPATGTFTPTGPLEAPRSGHTATLLPDGRVLVVGGMVIDAAAESPGRFLATAELWDPATGTFTPTGPLEAPRSGHTATLLPDGRVLVVGGYGADRDALVTAELWDPATGTFAPTGSLEGTRDVGTATLLLDGRVLVVGESGPSDIPIASAELWDPTTGSFGPTGSPAVPRLAHTATLLSDGRVLVVGGYDSAEDEALASAELWDPAAGSFGPTGSLAEAHWAHTATLLPADRVLVVGGRGARGLLLASAESWHRAGRA